jgi:hypothetical protein
MLRRYIPVTYGTISILSVIFLCKSENLSQLHQSLNNSSDAEGYKEYSVRCVHISRKELHELHRREKSATEDTLTAKTHGPLTWVAVTGCTFSVLIFALAIWQNDGMAILADILLSFLSTLVGFATKWKLTLPTRKKKSQFTPPGDVAVRYTKGSFLLVQCDEDVARELYFAPENIDYLVQTSWKYRLISLVGTIMLMFGVIFLANSQTPLQLAFAGAYIIMNILYWVVAALPNRVHWDTSSFKVTDQCIEMIPDKHSTVVPDPKKHIRRALPQGLGKRKRRFVDFNETFTEALWKTIVVTKSTEWVRKSAAAPDTPAWNEWLQKAEERARLAGSRYEMINGERTLVWELPDWEPGKALGECLMKHSTTGLSEKTPLTTPPLLEADTQPGADDNV